MDLPIEGLNILQFLKHALLMFTKHAYFVKAICFVMLLSVSSSILAQNRITGKITNQADNQPIVGATVQEKGTTNATQTGADGAFAITAASNGTLVISDH